MRKIIRNIVSTPAVATIKNICTGDMQNVDFQIFGDFDIAKAWRMAKRYVTNEDERVVDVRVGDTVTTRHAMTLDKFVENAEVVTEDTQPGLEAE